MRRENINYLVVGVFVITMMVVCFYVLYKVAGKSGPADNYYVTYKNVAGIKYGTPVLYEGYLIGQVDSVDPDRSKQGTSYKITLSVEKDWKIPEDSIASIVASGLLSAITISINEGESQSALNPGDFIQGQEAANIFAAVNEVAANISDLSENNIKPMLNNFDNHVETIVNELKDISINSIKPLIANINEKIDQPEMIQDLREMLDKLNKSADSIQQILSEKNKQNLEQTLVNLESSSGSLNVLLEDLDESSELVNKIITDLDELVDNNKDNVEVSITDLQKSLEVISDHINSIVHHMEGSSRNIHELSRQVRENPGLILKGSPQPEKGEE